MGRAAPKTVHAGDDAGRRARAATRGSRRGGKPSASRAARRTDAASDAPHAGAHGPGEETQQLAQLHHQRPVENRAVRGSGNAHHLAEQHLAEQRLVRVGDGQPCEARSRSRGCERGEGGRTPVGDARRRHHAPGMRCPQDGQQAARVPGRAVLRLSAESPGCLDPPPPSVPASRRTLGEAPSALGPVALEATNGVEHVILADDLVERRTVAHGVLAI